eukprot:scaffold1328_cov375-Pavlova_lutheri.AAC.32
MIARCEEEAGGVSAKKQAQIPDTMAKEGEQPPLEEMDQNVAQDIVPVVASKQVVARGTWTAEHRILLLRQCCIDSCNPITKQGNIATSCARNCLQFALRADPNRMFDGFSLSIDSLRRHVRLAMSRQKKRNQQARAATGRGGTSVHTDEEELAQHLLEQHEKMENERTALEEGRAARSSKLDAEGRVHLSCQMHTHRKKRRSEDPAATCVGAARAKGLTRWVGANSTYERILQAAVEERVRLRAGKEWMRFYNLHEVSPEKWSDPGTHMDYVERALLEHRKSLAPQPTHVEDEVVPLSSEMEEEGTPEA